MWWKSFSIFALVPERDINRFFAETPGVRKVVPAGQYIHNAGDRLEYFELLVRGRAVSRLPSEMGASVTAAYFQSPDYLAPGIVFAEEPDLPVEIQAVTEVEVHRWAPHEILNLCRTSPPFLKALLALLGGRIRFLAARVANLKTLSLRTRLSRYLVDLPRIDAPLPTVQLPFSKEALAAYFGVTRPSLSRCFSQMLTEGVLVRVEGRLVCWRSDKDLAQEVVQRL